MKRVYALMFGLLLKPREPPRQLLLNGFAYMV
jgi:hypothetical protein